ncbi:MAG: AI-2E family transporter [Halioglobus sp.]
MNNDAQPMTSRDFIDGLIRVGLLFLLVFMCFRVFSPFMNLMLWALIMAVTLYPTHCKLAARLGGRDGRAATVIVVLGLLLLGGPFVLFASSLADQLTSMYESYRAGTLALPPPKEAVAAWPIIGENVYNGWAAASANLPEYIEANRAAVGHFMERGIGIARGTLTGIFLFLGALIVAGIMMAYGEGGSNAMEKILVRIAGKDQGPRMHRLATMTTRSVAVGVLGVAIIQAILLGIGFVAIDLPGAGLLALVVLLLAIMQLPALFVSLPAIIWLWNSGDAGATMNIVWTIYLFLAGLSDNFLKPLLLGRGVDAPMPVILIGALGGMVSSGFIGLFIGAVLLAVGYQLFMQWVESSLEERDEEDIETQAPATGE